MRLLPGVHRVASLVKGWLLGTHQGSVDEAHLQSYLDEFVFRFNRRRSRSRGIVFYRVLELAVTHAPSALPGVGRRPPIEADTAFTAGKTRAPADHGQATRGSTMASILNR